MCYKSVFRDITQIEYEHKRRKKEREIKKLKENSNTLSKRLDDLDPVKARIILSSKLPLTALFRKGI